MVLMNRYTAGQLDERQSAVLAAASPGVDVAFDEVPESAGGGATTNYHRAVVAPAFARKARAAEQAGFDAVLPWGTLDLGVEEARHVVRIPVVGLRHVGMRPMEMSTQRAELRRRFVSQATELVTTHGAELILPLGFSMVPVAMSAAELSDEIGVPVLDPLALVMRVAEALAASGFRNSRVAYPEATI